MQYHSLAKETADGIGSNDSLPQTLLPFHLLLVSISILKLESNWGNITENGEWPKESRGKKITCEISTASDDGLAPSGARPSADAIMKKFCSYIYRGMQLNVQPFYLKQFDMSFLI